MTSTLLVKNKVDITNLTQRSFYPDCSSFILKLLTVKKHLDGVFSSPSVLRPYLTSLYANAQDLWIYADYIGHTSVEHGGQNFGAIDGDHPIGGGKGYPEIVGEPIVVTEDNGLKAALQNAKSGDVVVIPKDTVIDMSDWLLGGETIGFTAESGKLKYEMIIPEGVTLMGERGIDGQGGAMIKASAYTNMLMRLEKNARLCGLCIQGPDRPEDRNNISDNHSSGIVITGDGAVIENCEIAGFYHKAIRVENAKDVLLSHNYIHHVLGQSGVALKVTDASLQLNSNLFTHVQTIADVSGDESDVRFENNIDVFENADRRTVGGKISFKNNTFLSRGAFGENNRFENNLFAYKEDAYALADSKNNLFDILSPTLSSDKSVSVGAFIPREKEVDAPKVGRVSPLVLCASYYDSNTDKAFCLLREILANDDSALLSAVKEKINEMISSIGNYSNYLDFLDRDLIDVTVDGELYGPRGDEKGPIGGGEGYYQIYTEKDADFVVSTKEELFAAMEKAVAGQIVYIDENARIDLSNAAEGKIDILLPPEGITICSNRGFVHPDGRVSTGGMIKSTAIVLGQIMILYHPNVRITGLCIQGADPAFHYNHNMRSAKFEGPVINKYYYGFPTTQGIFVRADNVEIDNCELSGFSHSAIALREVKREKVEGQKDIVTPSRGTLVHHNYEHHNQRSGLGYGVSHDYSYSEVFCNLFNFNRHSIAGTGVPQSGYISRDNIEMGSSTGHFFDMHGGRDRRDGTDIAGEYMHVFNNALLGPYNPYYLRGTPLDAYTFHHNTIYKGSKDYRGVLTRNHGGRDEIVEKLTIGKNLWEISTSDGVVVEGAD